MGRVRDGRWISADEELAEFNRQEFGTDDYAEIREVIRSREWQARQDNLTGMEKEQAEWESEDGAEW